MVDARGSSERRDYIRMFVDATVSFRLPGNPEMHSGKSRNLSGSGLLFHSPVTMESGLSFEFRLGSEQSKLPPLEGEARVVRVSVSEGSGFEIAAEIIRIL